MKTTKSSATQPRVVAQWVCVSLLMIVLACIAGFLLPPLAYGAEGNLQWVKRPAGGTGGGQGIAVDGSGNSYVTGDFGGTATFGPGEANQTILTSAGNTDIFVAKYDTSGLLQWAKRAGGNSQIGYGIAVDGSGNSYVTGEFFGTATFGLGEANQTTLTTADSTDITDIFVAKYDTSGLLQWAKRAGGASLDHGSGIAVDGSGNSYITGYFDDTATFGLGEANQTILTTAGAISDIFVAKYNTSGLLQWAKRAGGIGGQVGSGIAVDGSGNNYVTGRFSNTATFGLGEANQTILASAGSSDIFVAKYDTSGLLQWAKRAGGNSGEVGWGIAVDGSGNSYVTGAFGGTATFGLGEANQTILTTAGAISDIFVAKYNTSGLLQWAKRAGGIGIKLDAGSGIAVDGSGNSYVTGDFLGTATFGLGEANQTILTTAGGGTDIFVAKYDTNGLLQWAKRAGGPGINFDAGSGIAVDGSGNSYVTGAFDGTATFGSGEWTFSDGNPIFVAKFLGSTVNDLSLSPVDFDGDGATDSAVYETSTDWFFVGTSWGFAYHLGFGGPSYLPVPGDYDGDGVADIAVYETNSGDWFYIGSTVGLQSHTNFGGPGYVPVPGDYDGDGVTDFAVYHAVAGHWFIDETTAGHKIHPSFGGPGYVPVPGDYDGDGKTDIAVYRTGGGAWCYVGSTSGIVCQAAFGGPGYVPVPGDYDGDGKSDIAVYQTSSGNWFWVGSTLGFDSHLGFGGSGFVPVPGDYDGDGAVDTAVYQESTGNWVVVGTTSGYFTPALNFGGAGFVPVLPQMTILRAMGLL